jgi:hypothetical protein
MVRKMHSNEMEAQRSYYEAKLLTNMHNAESKYQEHVNNIKKRYEEKLTQGDKEKMQLG